MTKHGAQNGAKKNGSNGSIIPQTKTKTEAIQADRERYLPRGVYTYHDVFPACASGARITDVDGNTYLDFAGGIGVMNVGHSHPAVVAAIQEQAALYTHTCAHVATPPPYIELAQAPHRDHAGQVPQEDAAGEQRRRGGRERHQDRARRDRTHRHHLVREQLPRAHESRALAHRQGAPLSRRTSARSPPTSTRFPIPTATSARITHDDACCREWETALERAFLTRIAPEQVAAIIVEPVQGEGGFVVPPADFLPTLRDDLLAPRHPADRRRGADGLRAHRDACSPSSITASSRT